METTLQEIYCNYLKEESFPATKIVEEGNVFFKAEGRTYVIRTDADSPERFALVLPPSGRLRMTQRHIVP
jgi:hypothetical protein